MLIDEIANQDIENLKTNRKVSKVRRKWWKLSVKWRK